MTNLFDMNNTARQHMGKKPRGYYRDSRPVTAVVGVKSKTLEAAATTLFPTAHVLVKNNNGNYYLLWKRRRRGCVEECGGAHERAGAATTFAATNTKVFKSLNGVVYNYD